MHRHRGHVPIPVHRKGAERGVFRAKQEIKEVLRMDEILRPLMRKVWKVWYVYTSGLTG